MRSGDLDEQIVIQQVSLSTDALGSSQTESWSTFATVWAKVIPMTASERFVSQEKYSANVNKFQIRFLSGLLPTMRIQYSSKVWRILGISEIRRYEGHEILAEVLV